MKTSFLGFPNFQGSRPRDPEVAAATLTARNGRIRPRGPRARDVKVVAPATPSGQFVMLAVLNPFLESVVPSEVRLRLTGLDDTPESC